MIKLSCEEPTLISELLIKKGMKLSMPCGGRGTCLKCKVKAFGDVIKASGNELALLTKAELDANIRYACMAYVKGNVQVEYFSENHIDTPDKNKIETKGFMPLITLKPRNSLTFGISVDIGTTTIAVYLYDLMSGKNIDVISDMNPQVKYGSDVISRINKSLEGAKKELSGTIVDCLNELINKILLINKIDKIDLGTVIITGNTAMMYLLLAHDTSGIAKMPFIQDNYFGEFLNPAELGIDVPSECEIYLTRSISSYVGGDITSAIIASELYKADKSDKNRGRILVDIGTNGEMALTCNNMLLCCATAAGPVFEGAGIYNGMTAKEGAIYKITIEDGKLVPYVLGTDDNNGEQSAQGICGSGIIDAVAAMLELGIIDETGFFCDGEDFYILQGTNVQITQKDIRQVQLAKSAICAGMHTLIHEAGLEPEDIDELVVAGGFGNNINIESAEKIGLIPAGFSKKARFIGNAAGTGASMILLNEDLLKLSEEVSKKAQTVDLSTDKFFMDKYVEGMYF